jgi:hypothetical protein
MDSENVSRETSLRSVCGEIVHPAWGTISHLRGSQTLRVTEERAGVHFIRERLRLAVVLAWRAANLGGGV